MLRGINGRVFCGNTGGECSGEAVVTFLKSQMPWNALQAQQHVREITKGFIMKMLFTQVRMRNSRLHSHLQLR